jgi:hypothetical protein
MSTVCAQPNCPEIVDGSGPYEYCDRHSYMPVVDAIERLEPTLQGIAQGQRRIEDRLDRLSQIIGRKL